MLYPKFNKFKNDFNQFNVSNANDTCASERAAPCQEQRLLHILEQGAHALARVKHLMYHLHVQYHEYILNNVLTYHIVF